MHFAAVAYVGESTAEPLRYFVLFDFQLSFTYISYLLMMTLFLGLPLSIEREKCEWVQDLDMDCAGGAASRLGHYRPY